MRIVAFGKYSLLLLSTLTFNIAVFGGLITHWELDGDASDASGNGFAGTLVNSPSFGTGQVGQAIDLNGSNQYVEVADGAGSLQPGSPPSAMSISAWFRTDTIAPSIQIIADKGHNTINGAGWALSINSGIPTFTYGGFQNATSPLVTAGNWYHLVGVFDGTDMSIYLNGVQGTTTTLTTGGTVKSTTPLRIGAWANPPSLSPLNFFNGSIDEVRLYDHALSASEITALSAVPEPSTYALISLAILGACLVLKRKFSKKAE